MYLTRRIYIGANYEWNDITGEIDLYKRGNKMPIDLKRVKYIEQEGVYWRKANEVHKWFVDKVQEGNDDCDEYWVSTENLEELKDRCKKIVDTAIIDNEQITDKDLEDNKILKKILNSSNIDFDKSLAEATLPTQEGFFFGSYEYDQYYIYDIVFTYIELQKLLNEESEFKEKHIDICYYYHSSW